MDEIKTGVFEISTAKNEFWQDWQLELAEEELKRRARTAMNGIMRDGVPYVTCLYPVVERGGKLVLVGFCVLAHWKDCEIGEAVLVRDGDEGPAWALTGRRFELEAETARNLYQVYIYRRIL